MPPSVSSSTALISPIPFSAESRARPTANEKLKSSVQVYDISIAVLISNKNFFFVRTLSRTLWRFFVQIISKDTFYSDVSLLSACTDPTKTLHT
jgi:hypothetical protein